MPYYEYETIPGEKDEQPLRFEIRQSMSDATLTCHPETGQPIRKVYSGFNVGAMSSSPAPSGSSGCCGGGCGCPH